MSGDYTRVRFDPVRGFSGVRKQQGRVSLDSDFNEFEEILDRRDRAAAYDTMGRAVFPATTPEAFKIGVGTGGSITIGVGRAYVDGICVECFGDRGKPTDPATTRFEEHLADDLGTAPLPYDQQPFFYQPGYPMRTATPGEANLFYLDVWQREVTIYEDDSLGEPALGGPDTTTRMQAAWQVKALEVAAGVTCSTELTAWDDLTAWSTARMSSGSVTVAPAPGPCVISPQGGYSGLENRLYRVEIHQAGTLGGTAKARFKWSRDNASSAATVDKIVKAPGGRSVITVGSTGRDSWTRFEVGQHLELLDDHVEFAMRQTGVGGKLVRILDVNHATGEVTVSDDLSAFAIDKKRRPRVRRWDSAGPAEDLSREVGVNATTQLEDGVNVTFNGTADDTLHAGDYWVFTARTATGEVESLVNEPPRGMHHHFMKLAVLEAGSGEPDDCRVKWPPECTCNDGGCGCDACVTVESHTSGELTVQAAVDQVVSQGGGTVCIGVGVYRIDAPVTLTDAVSVRVRGAGQETVLWHGADGPVMLVEGCVDVEIRDLTLVAEREQRTPDCCLQVVSSALVALEGLHVFEDPFDLVDFLATDHTAGLGAALALDGLVLGLSVKDCLLAGPVGVAPLATLALRDGGFLVTADLTLRDNLVFATLVGVLLGAPEEQLPVFHVDSTTVVDNSVYGCLMTGIEIRGHVPFGAVLCGRNVIGCYGVGVVAGTSNTTITSNVVVALPLDTDRRRVAVDLVGGVRGEVTDQHVTQNRLEGFADGAVCLDGSFGDAWISLNLVQRCGGGVNMTVESTAARVTVTGNRVAEVQVATRRGDLLRGAIALVHVAEAAVLDNSVEEVSSDEDAPGVWGIATVGCGTARIARNQVRGVVSRGPGPFSAGIGCFEHGDTLDIVDNHASIQGDDGGFALLVGWPDIPPPHWRHLLIHADEGRFWASRTSVVGHEGPGSRTPANIRGNILDTQANVQTVLVVDSGASVFSDNQCAHKAAHDPIVELNAFTVVFASNQVRAEHELVSVRLRVQERGFMTRDQQDVPLEAATVLGNITNGPILVNGNPLSDPWSPLNVRLT